MIFVVLDRSGGDVEQVFAASRQMIIHPQVTLANVISAHVAKILIDVRVVKYASFRLSPARSIVEAS